MVECWGPSSNGGALSHCQLWIIARCPRSKRSSGKGRERGYPVERYISVSTLKLGFGLLAVGSPQGACFALSAARRSARLAAVGAAPPAAAIAAAMLGSSFSGELGARILAFLSAAAAAC